MSFYSDTINSLSKIGNNANENYNSTNYSKADWNVNKYNDCIGYISMKGLFTLLSNPYQNPRKGDSLSSEYNILDRNTDQLIVTYTEQGDPIPTKLTIRYSSSHYDRNFYFTYNNEEFKVSLTASFPTTRTAKDGTIIYIKSANDVYYNKKNTIKYTQIFNLAVSTNQGNGIPYYCWHTDGSRIWVGIKLNLYHDDRKNPKSLEKTGWVLVVSDAYDTGYSLIVRVKENIKDNIAPTISSPSKVEEEEKEEAQSNSIDLAEYLDPNADYANSADYDAAVLAKDNEYDLDYWTNQYGSNTSYSLKSHNSIIGLPLQFMGNVDLRPGSSTYGKQYLEDILYDMNIAIIKPGGPVLNPKWDGGEYSEDVFNKALRTGTKLAAYWDRLKNVGTSQFLQDCLFAMFKGSSARFYSFQSDYTYYTHYVNTLCHLFITYLGIGEMEYINARGDTKKYCEYVDDIKEIETDGGAGIKNQMGFDNSIYLYYSDEGSALNQTFTNSTMQSGLTSTLNEASNAVKEWGFLINAAGIEKARGVIDLQGIASTASNYSNSILGRLLGKATEGVTTILAGNNVSFPEIYADSDTTVQHTFKVKLVSPYGDPESIFLYVLRPLARILAFSLPRQFSANSYGSPFIVQAFSKGQFNCQLGIVTELAITRCGNGGESHSINHIPTELEVSITIQDMYEKVFLSNEYFGNTALKSIAGAWFDHVTGSSAGSTMAQFFSTNTAAKLLFNNVGLIDFMASFCGYNLNQPPYMTGWSTIRTMMKNRCAEYMTWSENDGWQFPQWEKQINDWFNQAVLNLTTHMTTYS